MILAAKKNIDRRSIEDKSEYVMNTIVDCQQIGATRRSNGGRRGEITVRDITRLIAI